MIYKGKVYVIYIHSYAFQATYTDQFNFIA